MSLVIVVQGQSEARRFFGIYRIGTASVQEAEEPRRKVWRFLNVLPNWKFGLIRPFACRYALAQWWFVLSLSFSLWLVDLIPREGYVLITSSNMCGSIVIFFGQALISPTKSYAWIEYLIYKV